MTLERTPAQQSRRRALPWVVLLLGVLAFAMPTLLEMWTQAHNNDKIATFRSNVYSEEQRASQQRAIDSYQERLEHGRFATNALPGDNGATDSTSEFLAAGEVLFVLHIPKIDLVIPVYYGTTELSLSMGAGLLENTSFPGHVGGHAVVTGHRGGNTHRLFRDLDQLETGDPIYIELHDEILKYTVRSEMVVLPSQTDVVALEPGRDIVTLVSCDPPPVNSHRLLVRTERATITPEEVMALDVSHEEAEGHPIPIIDLGLLPFFIVSLVILVVAWRRAKRKNRADIDTVRLVGSSQ